jgi:thioredoxin reductase (NADPH)
LAAVRAVWRWPFPWDGLPPHITLFTNGAFEVGQQLRDRFSEAGYPLNEQPIRQFLDENHHMSGVALADGAVVELDAGLVSMGFKYHADSPPNLDLKYQDGNLITDNINRTSQPRIFAIGDLKIGMNQVVIAAADGANAVTQIWRDIRRQEGTCHLETIHAVIP